MSAEGMNVTPESAEIKSLEEEYLNATRELRRLKNKLQRWKLKMHIEEVKMDLAWAYLNDGKYDKGLALYQTVPWRIHGERKCNGIARALTDMGHYDEAWRLLKAGLRRYPKSYALWVGMGALNESMGDDFEALNCMEAALPFAPEGDPVARYNKALTLIKLGCYGDARPIIDELIERFPDHPKIISQKGTLLHEMGYSQEALGYYQKAMDLWQNHPTTPEGVCIYSGLCSAYLQLGMKREAMEVALEGLKKFPDEDPVLYHNAGAVYYEMGWQNESIEILKKGVEKFPDDEELKNFLKDMEDDTDDPDDNVNPPLLGLFLLMTWLYKKGRKK